MSEQEIQKLFSSMFGGAKPKDESVAKAEERKPEAETEKVENPKDEEPKAEETKPEVEPKEANDEKADKDQKPDEDDGVDQKLIDDAKKELGIGGAAFCDELLVGTPDAFARLKDAGKTLHGFFNFAYSYAMGEYVKANGRVNGGGYWNLSALLEKYLDPSVAEGYTVKEPKAKPYVPPKASAESAAKTVATVAKKAAKAAKKEAAKKEEAKNIETKTEEPVFTMPKMNFKSGVGGLFAGRDMSKFMKKV